MSKSLISLLIFFLFFIVSLLAISLVYQQVRRFFLTRSSPKKSEKEGGLLLDTFQDVISDLKQKERALEQMNENILRSVTSGVITFNCDGKVMTLNPAAETILGVQREAVLGKGCDSVFGTNNILSTFVQETLRERQNALREESEAVCPDGKKVWLGLTTSALRAPTGTVIGAIVVFTDLTEMKVLREQVDLQKRLALLGEMSSFIAHEFRNYMATIWGFASMLSKEVRSNDEAQKMAAGIIKEVATMEQLIADLLSYGKKPVLTLKQTAIIPLIKEALEQFRESFPPLPTDFRSGGFNTEGEGEGGDGQSISFSTEFEECEAAVDAVLLGQVILNLVQNGLEAMESEGSLIITAGYLGERFVEIKISDTGKGIPNDQLDKIFLPFFTTKAKGNGLGLALVHKTILSHNGTISVESKENQGTTFTITLPAQRNVTA